MNKRTWQRSEQAVARSLGGRRRGNVGDAGSDISTPAWRVEVKARRALPALVTGALQQAEIARSGHQVAIAVLHPLGGRRDRDVVCMRWADFAALLLGDAPEDRRTRAAIELAGASDADRRVLAPDLVGA